MQSKPGKLSVFELLKEGTTFKSKPVQPKKDATKKPKKETSEQPKKLKENSIQPDSESEIEEEGFFRAKTHEEHQETQDEHENSKAENRRTDRVAKNDMWKIL